MLAFFQTFFLCGRVQNFISTHLVFCGGLDFSSVPKLCNQIVKGKLICPLKSFNLCYFLNVNDFNGEAVHNKSVN